MVALLLLFAKVIQSVSYFYVILLMAIFQLLKVYNYFFYHEFFFCKCLDCLLIRAWQIKLYTKVLVQQNKDNISFSRIY